MTPKAKAIIEFISDAINDLFFELYDVYPGLKINFTVENVEQNEEVDLLSRFLT